MSEVVPHEEPPVKSGHYMSILMIQKIHCFLRLTKVTTLVLKMKVTWYLKWGLLSSLSNSNCHPYLRRLRMNLSVTPPMKSLG